VDKDNHAQLLFAVAFVLRQRREALLITQSELARLCGLHRSYIAGVERGARNIAIQNVSRLASALDMAASKVLSLAEKKLAREGPFKLKRKKSK
jgi:transcriptional regulator with XRE-family HTH domain